MNDIIHKVDVERMYQHVLKIEGVKHHIENPEKLNETADYILSEFQKYGLNPRFDSFRLGLFATRLNFQILVDKEI